ncbi:winged helix-turn-helix domain-containing protein [Lutimaribacter saemankumensis]|uniref:TolB amino-terminal domain-containing protein n=1 Tax=Lutimaribacter saemankumensis TaxID=490829 RepID=A0A1G8TP47_9RHOB|nr:winged helix-turn-helix domain-containing protein [Lutimaribacter saemankumensis]SDJ43308.1 TolB amino-terminal domain-containing protein [Lutimaribacter saemankumensis]
MRFVKRRDLKSSEIDLGAAVLDCSVGKLFASDGRELDLRHQSREVLMALARKRGETVSQDALIEEVWQGRTVTADSVAQCIAEIRRVLEDSDKRIVETVPRKGYRLVPPPAAATEATGHQLRRRRLVLFAVAVLVACALAFTLLRQAEPPGPPVIAVLPFDDFSPPQHQGYLSDAVSDNIITLLARYPQFVVISQRSSFTFRDSDLAMSEIAERLGADYLLEGSQQYDGARVRTMARLIDGATEASLWADEFDVPLNELLQANSRISRKIAGAVGEKVVDMAEPRMSEGDVSALLIANAAQSRIMRNFTRESLLVNIAEQEQSIRDYPESAWGPLGQALSLRIGLRYGWVEGDEDAIRKRMDELAHRAVELDPNNFLAFHALGRVLMFNRDVDGAINAFRRAVELNPSSSFARNALAQALAFVAKTDEALEEIAEIELIDPLYGHDTNWTKARIQWQSGACSDALVTFGAAPSMPVAANKTLAAIHHCLGNSDKAKAAMSDFLGENPDWTVTRERAVITGVWAAPGLADRWLAAMIATGMPL